MLLSKISLIYIPFLLGLIVAAAPTSLATSNDIGLPPRTKNEKFEQLEKRVRPPKDAAASGSGSNQNQQSGEGGGRQPGRGQRIRACEECGTNYLAAARGDRGFCPDCEQGSESESESDHDDRIVPQQRPQQHVTHTGGHGMPGRLEGPRPLHNPGTFEGGLMLSNPYPAAPAQQYQQPGRGGQQAPIEISDSDSDTGHHQGQGQFGLGRGGSQRQPRYQAHTRASTSTSQPRPGGQTRQQTLPPPQQQQFGSHYASPQHAPTPGSSGGTGTGFGFDDFGADVDYQGSADPWSAGAGAGSSHTQQQQYTGGGGGSWHLPQMHAGTSTQHHQPQQPANVPQPQYPTQFAFAGVPPPQPLHAQAQAHTGGGFFPHPTHANTLPLPQLTHTTAHNPPQHQMFGGGGGFFPPQPQAQPQQTHGIIPQFPHFGAPAQPPQFHAAAAPPPLPPTQHQFGGMFQHGGHGNVQPQTHGPGHPVTQTQAPAHTYTPWSPSTWGPAMPPNYRDPGAPRPPNTPSP